MKIYVTSVLVDDQAKAREFYTKTLGFVIKHDIDMGGGAFWLTVVSPENTGGTELLLEAGRPPRSGSVPFCPCCGRHPLHLVPGRRHRSRAQAPHGPWRPLHGSAHGCRHGQDGRLRRHLRQPHPDRPDGGGA